MLTAVETLALKAAEKRLVSRSGGQEACTLVPGMRLKRHQSFNDFGNPDLPERHMPVDVLAALERFSGPEVTRVLAELAGCLLIPLPKGAGVGELAQDIGLSSEAFGALMHEMGTTIADGSIDRREERRVLADIRRLMLALATLAETVRAKAARDAGDGEGGAA